MMKLEDVEAFFELENRRYLAVEEACCFVAHLLSEIGETYTAEVRRKIRQTGYFNISDNILVKAMTFFRDNNYCELTEKRQTAGRPVKLYKVCDVAAVEKLNQLWLSKVVVGQDRSIN